VNIDFTFNRGGWNDPKTWGLEPAELPLYWSGIKQRLSEGYPVAEIVRQIAKIKACDALQTAPDYVG